MRHRRGHEHAFDTSPAMMRFNGTALALDQLHECEGANVLSLTLCGM